MLTISMIHDDSRPVYIYTVLCSCKWVYGWGM